MWSFDVKKDGTAKGNGIDDDTQAIQYAIDNVDIGGTVIIPPGVYRLTENVLNAHGTGYGTAYSALKITKPMTIQMEGAVFQTITGVVDDAYGVFWVFGTTEVHFKGGMLIGSSLPTDGDYNDRIGVLIEECDHCSIDGMYLCNYSQGVNVYNSDYCAVKNVEAEFCKGSGIIYFVCRDSLIEDCTVHNCFDGTISLYGGGKRNTVQYCRVSENRYNNRQGITLEKEIGSLIYKNYVSGCFYGIDIKNASDSCTIEGNYVHGNQHGVVIREGDDGVNEKAPSHNMKILNNNALYPKGDWPNYGIHIQTGTNHLVEGNLIGTNRIVYKMTTIHTPDYTTTDGTNIQFKDNIITAKFE